MYGQPLTGNVEGWMFSTGQNQNWTELFGRTEFDKGLFQNREPRGEGGPLGQTH